MPEVRFTENLRRHLDAPECRVEGTTVREALDRVFEMQPRLRGYVLDDQDRLRKHVVVFINGDMVRDRDGLSDPVSTDAELFVMQALSGG
ncbi:MAG: MoaD/ThiS family protein [Acidobacteriota bacterium]|nr:MoaD/ThiS family protein [Acidobacteriota bacterium]